MGESRQVGKMKHLWEYSFSFSIIIIISLHIIVCVRRRGREERPGVGIPVGNLPSFSDSSPFFVRFSPYLSSYSTHDFSPFFSHPSFCRFSRNIYFFLLTFCTDSKRNFSCYLYKYLFWFIFPFPPPLHFLFCLSLSISVIISPVIPHYNSHTGWVEESATGNKSHLYNEHEMYVGTYTSYFFLSLSLYIFISLFSYLVF